MTDQNGQTVCTNHRIDSARPGLKIALRNKHSAGHTAFAPERTLLMVHGATYPSTRVFDYAIDGVSWMDWLAAAGFDVWCVDVLGYGDSDRPPELSVPEADNPPVIDTADAEGDVERAMDFILGQRGISSMNLLGYSWGTAICGAVAGRRCDQVARLVLLGALWCKIASRGLPTTGKLGAYRWVTADAAVARWQIDLDADQVAAIVPEGRMQAWADHVITSDAEHGNGANPRMRAPAGVVKDVQECWTQDKPTYDPGKIIAPTAIVVGEWDHETTPEQGREVFARLTGTKDKRMVLIGAATHSMPLENQRIVLHQTVLSFLSEN
jgi:pimeloyl-ACP methyl ester carboxylesterase